MLGRYVVAFRDLSESNSPEFRHQNTVFIHIHHISLFRTITHPATPPCPSLHSLSSTQISLVKSSTSTSSSKPPIPSIHDFSPFFRQTLLQAPSLIYPQFPHIFSFLPAVKTPSVSQHQHIHISHHSSMVHCEQVILPCRGQCWRGQEQPMGAQGGSL